MAISIEQIDSWRLNDPESQRLEFKEAKRQYDTFKLCEYCVALANEGGGHLILGIADRMPRPVIGTEAFKDTNDIASKLLEWLNFRVDVEVIDHPRGRVLVFVVPSRQQGSAYHYHGKYLMRAGGSLVPMSEDRLRAIFAETKTDPLEEFEVSGISQEEAVELLDIASYFDLMRLPFPSSQEAAIERLRNERLIDVFDGKVSIRRVAALLLGKRLEAFPAIRRKAPRVVVYSESSKLETRLDQNGARGYAVGFSGLVKFVMNQLPQNEIIENALRREIKLVPEAAIRELIANALIHQDLKVQGASAMIEIYSNRIEISNPGEPIVPVERFIDGYQSRNERMAELMRRMGICEEKGSGIDRVVQTAEAYQLPAPVFSSTFGRSLVVIHGHRKFDEMDRDDRVRACYQHAALKYVMAERMTNQTLRERFRLPEAKTAVVSQVISAAIESDMIKADERAGTSRKFARYLPFWA